MTVWCKLITILKQYRALRTAALIALCVGISTTLFLGNLASAVAGVNQTLSFQGRILSASGSVVPDGHYNMQFKIYQDGTGTTAGNTGGSLKWTESYVNNNADGGVDVKDGFFSVTLGSQNPFGTSVDWNQDTLWLSMNVAGSAAACTTFGGTGCTADGEMLPMKRMTATPFALNSGRLGGKTADSFLQLSQGVQTDIVADTSSIFINKTTTGNLIQLQKNSTDIFTVGNAGDLTLGNNADKTISISTATADSAGNNLTVVAGGGGTGTGSTGGNLVLQGGTAGGTNANGGGVQIDSGAGVGTGTGGVISLGASNASAISLGNSSAITQITLNGPTSVKQATNTTDAFSVTNSLNGKVLTVDTTNGRVGIGNSGSLSYALDVGGDTNTSGNYRIGGVSTLTSSALAFSSASASSITAASGQSLTVGSSTSTTLQGSSSKITIDDNGVQIGTGSGIGEPTLLTLDSAGATPTGAAFGSMYYDTTSGKVQCYQAEGWGTCGDAPDSFVTISPEYTNAVMNGSGIGAITSDICSDTLNINDGTSGGTTVCGSNETYNFYDWKSAETSAQVRSIYVTYQLPDNFDNFVTGSTSLMARTDSTDATSSYQIYKSHGGSALSACGAEITASTGAKTSWQKSSAADGNDPSGCGFAAGDSILIRINMSSSNNANAYVSNLNFAYSNK